jgi:hypothetical protein
VPFTSIQQLNFSTTAWTSGRVRTPNQQQLQCISCTNVTSVVCKNVGTSNNLPVWSCTGPNCVDMYGETVHCEGCTYSGDPQVIVGSCYLSLDSSMCGRVGPPAPASGNILSQPDYVIVAITFGLSLICWFVYRVFRQMCRQTQVVALGGDAGKVPGNNNDGGNCGGGGSSCGGGGGASSCGGGGCGGGGSSSD